MQDGMLASVLETHYDETKEFLLHAGIVPWLLFLGMFVALLRLTRNVSKTSVVGVVVLVILLLFPMLKVAIPSWLNLSMRETYEFKQYPVEMMGSKYRTYLVTKEPAMIAGYYAAQSKINDALNKTRVLPAGITFDTATVKKSPRRIIIVLGESDNKKHHGIYGYVSPTDHFMMSMLQNKNKIAVFDAVSPAPVTREAVIRMFSLATARQIEPFTNHVGLLEMARNAGYQTLWLSKQGGIGLHDTLVKVITLQADKVSFPAGQFDDTLLEPFSDGLKEGTKQLFVLHLRGSHLGYKYGHNQADFERAANSLPKYRHYDATIANTDKFLESLASIVGEDKNTLFIYVPDHGEIVNKGHGLPRLDVQQYEVPFVIWSGNEGLVQQAKFFVDKYSVRYKNEKIFNTVSLPLVLAEMMGYQISDACRDQALEDSQYIFSVDGNAYPIEQLE